MLRRDLLKRVSAAMAIGTVGSTALTQVPSILGAAAEANLPDLPPPPPESLKAVAAEAVRFGGYELQSTEFEAKPWGSLPTDVFEFPLEPAESKLYRPNDLLQARDIPKLRRETYFDDDWANRRVVRAVREELQRDRHRQLLILVNGYNHMARLKRLLPDFTLGLHDETFNISHRTYIAKGYLAPDEPAWTEPQLRERLAACQDGSCEKIIATLEFTQLCEWPHLTCSVIASGHFRVDHDDAS